MCNGVQSYLKDLSNVSITVLLNKDIFLPHVAVWHEPTHSCPYELDQPSRL